MSCRHRVALICGCLCIACLVACSKREEITRYRATRPSGALTTMRTGTKETADRSSTAQDRMLAAIVPRGDKTWFFKLTGPDAQVAEEQERFSQLIRSLRFSAESNQPDWELPSGWRRLPGGGMRYATLQIETAERPLEVTVIPLATSSGELDAYILANVNRWREQLALPAVKSLDPAESEQGSGPVARIELGDGTTATLVNLVGRSQTAARGAPMAGMLPPSHPPISGAGFSPAASDSAGPPPLSYDTPPGWSQGKVGGMRQAAFEVSEGERKLEITAISLPQSGGDRLENVNRWRQQIGLSPMTQEQLMQALEPIEVSGRNGDYIEIINADGDDPSEAILGALVDDSGKTWFFKLRGNAELARQEKARFKEFVQSVKFKTHTEPGDVE